ncbi:KRAB [Acanthosepion pharaonis]|uniref:KRAB n=1 Tax=Acanthosepion pharaonis TaxID=158019 RepID=A0A812CYJ4_ACAPH|nr:KRAB [Sepia pharaonis]
MVIHHSSKEYSCEQCGRGFRSLFLLDMHKKLMGGTCTRRKLQTSSQPGQDRWKQMCKYCSKRFALSSRLAKHVRNVHPEAEVFTCDVCDKGFCYYLEYLPHRRTHRNIPYQCKACELAFPTYKQLLQHRAGHPNPLRKSSLPSTDPSSIPTVSADAGVSANSSDTIGESDPGKGQDAGNSGGDENSSTGQVRINESSTDPGLPVPVSESLVCQICRLVFLTKLNYQKHCRLVHGKMKYSCQSCDENFDLRRLLDIHTKRCHPKKPGRKKKKKKEEEEKNIKSKIIKPKRAPKYDPARLERFFKACVKRAKERSKKKSLGTKREKVVKLSMMNYVLD